MSLGYDKIGRNPGEQFETIVQMVLNSAGFRTERRRKFPLAVTHEIDVWGELEVGGKIISVAVECKDWNFMALKTMKEICDIFIGKLHQITPKADAGLVVVHLPDRGQYAQYRQQLRDMGLTLWDSKDLEKWIEDISRYDRVQYQKRLFEALGIQVQEPTDKDKSMKVLKTLGRFALKSAKVGANVSMKVLDNIADDDSTYAKQRRKGRRRSRRYS